MTYPNKPAAKFHLTILACCLFAVPGFSQTREKKPSAKNFPTLINESLMEFEGKKFSLS